MKCVLYPKSPKLLPLRVSIIINTDARAKSLALALESLRHLAYEPFEVCVVYGPTEDGTKELLASWSGRVKVAHCPNRNLSQSRNIGLAMAAGEIVAFLDDDSIPEPEWLSKVVQPFSNPEVAASGGFLRDHTGVGYQWRFGTASRTGTADQSWTRAAPEFNYPYTANFPHVMANSAFRLSAVLAIGGFDEQYIYFLDETDLICRLVDHGYQVVQLTGAVVHHKYKASHIRGESRVLTSWHIIFRSKMYFSLVNAQGHHGIKEAVTATQRFFEELRRGLEWHIAQGAALPHLLDVIDQDYETGLSEGLKEGLANNRKLFEREKLRTFAASFSPFLTLSPPGRSRCVCLLTRTYPPGSIGGIGRYVHQLARSLAALGHQVHVMTEATQDAVDFEQGVWVHRLSRKHHGRPPRARNLCVPQHIWDYSATMLSGVAEIAEDREVDAVLAPIWDCEGVAFHLDGRWPLITSLHTTLRFYLDSHGHLETDAAFMRDFVNPMLATEAALLTESWAILANSRAIVDEIEQAYGVSFDPKCLGIVPHGQEDWTAMPAEDPSTLPPGAIRLVFVGRLEQRKGIDILLAALREVLPEHPTLHVDIVGNDHLEGPDGLTYRSAWSRQSTGEDYQSRVRFHGEVDEVKLRGFYRAADIFAAPSRFESFGLVLLEGMMYAKPVVGCRSGGMPEVVEDGVTGLLALPGDVESLAATLGRLAKDAALRERLGAAARARYEAEFTPERMGEGVLAFLDRVAESRSAGSGYLPR